MKENSTLLPRMSYANLDIAKFTCSLLVVFIHTAPFTNYPVAHFYTADVICRVAVPLFFAMSGFLFFRGAVFENGRIVWG